MKILLLMSLFFSATVTSAQFHLKITCNPDNGGKINPRWANNYIIAYTNDNWEHSFLIHQQATYEGFDNNGVTYYTSYWQPCSFQTQEEAYQVAHILTSQYSVGKFLSTEYQKHLRLDIKYKHIAKSLNFGESKTLNCIKEIVIK